MGNGRMMLFIREAHMGDRIYTGLLRRSFTLYIRDGSGFHGKELAKNQERQVGSRKFGANNSRTTEHNRQQSLRRITIKYLKPIELASLACSSTSNSV